MIASRNIEDLFPPVKRAALELIRRMKEKGYDIGISSTYRDYESQNAIYSQGRTMPGKIVTNAKAGNSMHNYRLAFDIFYNKKGDEYNDNVLKLAGKTGVEMGLEWGGNFKSIVDTPHFQWTDGLILADLKAGKMPVDKKLKWEMEQMDKPLNQNQAQPVQIDNIQLEIDGKIYNVNRILYNGINYIELRGFVQAGYNVGYIEAQKLPTISKN